MPQPKRKRIEDLPWWPGLFIRNPLLAGALGWTISAAGVYLFFFVALPEYRQFPKRPTDSTLDAALSEAGAGREVWVTLTDVRWNCGEQVQGGKVVVLAAPNGGRRFVAELGDGKRCEDMPDPPQGVMHLASERRTQFLLDKGGLRLDGKDQPLLMLCTYCGGDNARAGVIMAPLVVLLGLALYPGILRVRRREYGIK